MKKCSSCGVEKDFSMFQVRRASKDGLTSSCKHCLSIRDKKRANKPNRVLARFEYSKTERGREARKRATDAYELKNSFAVAESKKRWEDKNPKKKSVHGLVAYAIKNGVIKRRPCEICGHKKSHAHHDDYDKPLDVRWLCSRHHQEWHAANGAGANGD